MKTIQDLAREVGFSIEPETNQIYLYDGGGFRFDITVKLEAFAKSLQQRSEPVCNLCIDVVTLKYEVDSFINQLDELIPAYTKQPSTVSLEPYNKLLDKSKAVVARWDSPSWKDQPHTAEFINALRQAIAEAERDDE